jgi:hypothetical protein
VLDTIDLFHADLRRGAWDQLVRGEVVLQTLDQDGGQVAEVPGIVPDVIPLENRDDLVIRLAAIEQLDAAEDRRLVRRADRALRRRPRSTSAARARRAREGWKRCAAAGRP